MPNITGEINSNGGSTGDQFLSDVTTTKMTIKGAFSVTESMRVYNIKNGDDLYTTPKNIVFTANSGETKADGTLKTENEYHVYGNSNRVATDNIAVRIWQRVS